MKAIIVEQKNIRKLDRLLPLSGVLSQEGFVTTRLDVDLGKDFQERIDKLCNGNKVTPILQDDLPLVKSILTKLEVPIKQYLGGNAEITDAFWEKAITTNTAVSGAWHTDGCGHQIKIYWCGHIQGSMPTLVVPHSGSISSIRKLMIEAPRWFGTKALINPLNIKHQFAIDHQQGTLSAFDTNLLHRGAYSSVGSTRICLQIHINANGKSKSIKSPYLKPVGSKEFTQNKGLHQVIKEAGFQVA